MFTQIKVWFRNVFRRADVLVEQLADRIEERLHRSERAYLTILGAMQDRVKMAEVQIDVLVARLKLAEKELKEKLGGDA